MENCRGLQNMALLRVTCTHTNAAVKNIFRLYVIWANVNIKSHSHPCIVLKEVTMLNRCLDVWDFPLPCEPIWLERWRAEVWDGLVTWQLSTDPRTRKFLVRTFFFLFFTGSVLLKWTHTCFLFVQPCTGKWVSILLADWISPSLLLTNSSDVISSNVTSGTKERRLKPASSGSAAGRLAWSAITRAQQLIRRNTVGDNSAGIRSVAYKGRWMRLRHLDF